VDGMDILGYLAGLFTTAANVPQVITTYKKRSGEGLSFRMLAALATGLLLWIAYGFVVHSKPLMIFNAIALALVVSLVTMKFRFDRHPTKD
jgi:MtN3 and saliva related transmembrane protein